jgi:Phage minor capsid protein 2.
MLTEQQLQALPASLFKRFRRLNNALLAMIAARIKLFSETKQGDEVRIRQLSNIDADMRRYEADLQDALDYADAEIARTMAYAAEKEYYFTRTAFAAAGIAMVAFRDNAQAQQSLYVSIAATQAQIRNNASNLGLFSLPPLGSNISRTNAFNAPQWRHVQQVYRDTIDRAALAIRVGDTDFHSAMRKAIQEMADRGHTFVDYESGYHQRMDSAVRRDLMNAQSRLNLQYADIIGEQIGANGREVSLHSAPRPSHVWFAGHQFDNATFYRDVQPLMEEPNCYHSSWAILLGISPPTYTQDEIDAHNARDAELHEFNGKQYNAYDAQQKQRQYELAIRKQKDRAMMFNESGDTQQAHIASARARATQAEYKRFSDAMGKTVSPDRASVSGYRYVGNTNKSGHLPNSSNATIPTDKIKGYILNQNHETGRNKAKVIDSVLGYNESNWTDFSEKLYKSVQSSRVAAAKPFTYSSDGRIINAMKYEVPISMSGLKNRTLDMKTIWQIDGGKENPRFITLTFPKKRRDR